MVEKEVSLARLLLFGHILEIFRGFSPTFISVEGSSFNLFWSLGLT